MTLGIRPALAVAPRAALLFAAVAVGTPASLASQRADARPAVFVRDAGPGRPGRILRSALAAPHVVLPADSAHPARLRRDTTFAATVIVLGGDAAVASAVHGDVIVVGGDLFLHPGASVDGRVVAIGGGVYNSTLAVVRGERLAFRDATFLRAATAQGIALDYQALERRDLRVFTLPGAYGLRIPTYDRVNGLSLPFGPTLAFDTARIEVEPTITYRSDLGALDPALDLRAQIGRRLVAQVDVGRRTPTNEGWIRSDIMNALTALAVGSDVRNYWRSDRARGVVRMLFESATAEIEPYVGALAERDWSVGPFAGETSAPWSALGRRDPFGMRRPNPPVRRGRITSALTGARLEWESQGVQLHSAADLELPVQTPDARFAQLTFDGGVTFPTFGVQRLTVDAHLLATHGGPAPPQRYSYLGGSGTLPTFDLLQFGGDHLLLVDSRYDIPIDALVIPVLGAPTVTLRHALGGAAPGKWPKLEQNVEVRLALSFLRAGIAVDPASHRTRSSFGLSLTR